MFKTQLPTAIKNVQRMVQEKNGPCIIAGGAIRDTVLGAHVKDVDVFISKANFKTSNIQTAVSGSWNLDSISSKAKFERAYESYMIDDMHDIRVDPLPVQIIVLKCDPEEYVTKCFDYGICKVWYDGQYTKFHNDFITDVNNKLITRVITDEKMAEMYSNRQWAVARMIEHGERIKRKYPAFELNHRL